MTEDRRSASEIRAYCEAATAPPWHIGHQRRDGVAVYSLEGKAPIASEIEANRAFILNARTDLSRALDAATGLYKVALWLVAQEGRKLTEQEAFELGRYLNEHTWLAEGPVPEGPLARAWREA